MPSTEDVATMVCFPGARPLCIGNTTVPCAFVVFWLTVAPSIVRVTWSLAMNWVRLWVSFAVTLRAVNGPAGLALLVSVRVAGVVLEATDSYTDGQLVLA